MSTIFTKIINGELPSYKIFENELIISFLTIEPTQLGHSLVVPKLEIDHWLDVKEPYYSEVFKYGKIIGEAIQLATKAPRVGAEIQGWEVPHFHLHIIPMWGPSDLDLRNAKTRSKEEMKEIQTKIVANLDY